MCSFLVPSSLYGGSIPLFHISLSYLDYTPIIVTALSMPTSVCPQPGVAMVHTFRKIDLTACHRHEPDASYCHWSAKRHCSGNTGVPKIK
jgi:hypothetical protein